MPKIANIGVFCHFRPLTSNKTLPNYFFLVEEVLSFDLVGHMWKSVKNWLWECVFNIYKSKLGRSRWIAYFENYLQKWFGDKYWDFPTRISHTIFPQQFPTTISHNHFPQDFPTRFSRKIFPQQFPARFSRNNFPQDFPARFSHDNFQKIFLQPFPARFSCKIFLQNFPELYPDWLAPHHPIPNANFHQSLPC